MNVVGLDIGGANIKAANVDGKALSRNFDLWKSPEQLSEQLTEILVEFSPFDLLAVTMTGELADCFETKSVGVDSILASTEQAAGQKPVYVWQTGAEFVTPEIAREIPLLVAAANWHALATWVGRMVPKGESLLIDVGSTTTDIIPILNGVPVPTGMTDVERLQSGELIYSAARRTPLCAIAHTVPFRGGYCPLAAEIFATMLDVYLVLKEIPENPDDSNTANGKPATVSAAHDRLAHMLCCDRSEFTSEDAIAVSHFLADVQKQRIAGAMEKVLSKFEGDCHSVIVSGSGLFLARKLVSDHPRTTESQLISLTDSFTPELAEASCAFAVARLASERLTKSNESV